MPFFLKKSVSYAIATVGIAIVAVSFRGYFANHITTIENFDAGFTGTVSRSIEQHAPALAKLAGVSAPCSSPIIYSLGTFDTGFGLTQAQFVEDINEAVQIWNTPYSRTFFQLASSSDPTYATAGDLKINLIYDYRQQATDAMNALGVSIDDETTVYNALKAKYTSLTAAYTSEKATLTSVESSFETAQGGYNQEVEYWNDHGGASADEYAELSQEKATLEAEAATITQDENLVNASVAMINSTASTINKYVALLNSEATRYNSVASSTGEEFDEGEYVTGPSGRHIDIFQYENQTKLIRVLAHELGHALGLGHSYTNSQAIMYPLNQGTDLSLAPEDLAALDKICGVQPPVVSSK